MHPFETNVRSNGGGSLCHLTLTLLATLSFSAAATSDVVYRPFEWRSVNLQGMGWVTGLVVHPAEPELIYIRTDVGGVFRYEPSDESWIPLMDQYGLGLQYPKIASLDVAGIALDPSDTDVVYAALGSDGQIPEDAIGDLYRSNDRGATWIELGLRRSDGLNVRIAGNGEHRQAGERLAVDPNQPNTVYFGSRADGMFRSVDGGATWSEVSVPAIGTDFIGITFVAIDPGSGAPGATSQRLVYGAAGDGLFESRDGGATWASIPGVGGGIPYQAAYTPSGDLFVSFRNRFDIGAPNGGLWKYTAQTETWADTSPAATGFSGVAVDFMDPERVVAKRDRLGFGLTTDLDISLDGGATWTTRARDVVAPPYYPVAERDGWEFETGALYFDPHVANRLWWVDGYAVYRNDAVSENPGTYRAIMKNLEELVINQLIAHPSGRLLIASWDMAGIAVDDVDAVPRERMTETFGRASSLAYSPSNPDTVYWVGALQFQRTPLGGVSFDGGETWEDLPSFPSGDPFGDGQIAVSATDSENLIWTSPVDWPLFPFTSETWYSTNGGLSWNESAGLPSSIISNAPHNGLNLIADGALGGTFYLFNCGPDNVFQGTYYRSTDGGVTFQIRAESYDLGCDNELTLRAEEGQPNTLWAASRDEFGNLSSLRRSLDGAATWTDIAQVDGAAYLDLGPPGPGRTNPTLWLYGVVRGFEGIWVSLDATALPGDAADARWFKVNGPEIGFSKITFVEADPVRPGRVYVGTSGRGVFVADR